MQTWKAGPVTIDVWEEGDPPLGDCSIAGCTEAAVWRSSASGLRCQVHAENTNAAIAGQHVLAAEADRG